MVELAGTAAGLCDARRMESDGAYRAAAVLGLAPFGLAALLGLIEDEVYAGMPAMARSLKRPNTQTRAE